MTRSVIHICLVMILLLGAAAFMRAYGQTPATTVRIDSHTRYIDQVNGMTADEAVAYALKNNPEIQAMRLEAEAGEALIRQARLRLVDPSAAQHHLPRTVAEQPHLVARHRRIVDAGSVRGIDRLDTIPQLDRERAERLVRQPRQARCLDHRVAVRLDVLRAEAVLASLEQGEQAGCIGLAARSELGRAERTRLERVKDVKVTATAPSTSCICSLYVPELKRSSKTQAITAISTKYLRSMW